jgi:hypothetical protein
MTNMRRWLRPVLCFMVAFSVALDYASQVVKMNAIGTVRNPVRADVSTVAILGAAR